MQLPPVVDFAKRLVKQVSDDEVPDLAAGLAYRFLFAIFPFAIFLAALSAFIAPALGLGDPTNDILGALSDNLPPDVAAQLRPQLDAVLGEARPGLLSIGAVTALWAATGGIAAVITAMNRAYDVDETRGFIPRTATAIGLTVLGSAGIVAAFVTLVGGSVITQEAVNSLGVGDAAWSTISIIRFPIVLAVVALAVGVLFKFGPNVRVSFRWTALGGFVFALIWTVGTIVFGLYVANFANYSNTYGALGGVVILMLWFYLTALMLLVAAEITSMIATDKEPERIEARRREVRPDTARRIGEVAGTLVGAAEGAIDGDDGPKGTPAPKRPPRRPALAMTTPTPVARSVSPPWRRPPMTPLDRAKALAIVAGGALAGAILGRLAGGDDDEGATSG